MEHEPAQNAPNKLAPDEFNPDEPNPFFTTETSDTESFARGMLEAQTEMDTP